MCHAVLLEMQAQSAAEMERNMVGNGNCDEAKVIWSFLGNGTEDASSELCSKDKTTKQNKN